MKTKFFKISLVVLVTMSGLLVSGQVNIGIKGAVSSSNMISDVPDIEEAARLGWQAGVFVRIGDKVHMQPEAYFTAKTGKLEYTGYNVSEPGQTGLITQAITLSSVDIPVLVGIRVIHKEDFNLRLQGGPVMSIVVNKKFDITSKGLVAPPISQDYRDGFKNTNWAMQFGAGVDLSLLTIDLRYELGLNDMFIDDFGMMTGHDPFVGDFRNYIFMLSLGFKII